MKYELNQFEMSVRASNCLKQLGIKTAEELASHNANELIDKNKNIGLKTIAEWRKILHTCCLDFQK